MNMGRSMSGIMTGITKGSMNRIVKKLGLWIALGLMQCFFLSLSFASPPQFISPPQPISSLQGPVRIAVAAEESGGFDFGGDAGEGELDAEEAPGDDEFMEFGGDDDTQQSEKALRDSQSSQGGYGMGADRLEDDPFAEDTGRESDGKSLFKENKDKSLDELVNEDGAEKSLSRYPKGTTRAMPAKTTGAEASRYDRIISVQPKATLKDIRIELMPYFGMSVNDAFWTHYWVGGDVLLFPHDTFALGFSGGYFFANKKTNAHEVIKQIETAIPAVFEQPTWTAAAQFHWTPFYGKFALFNKSIWHYDFYIGAGGGVVETLDTRPMATLSVGHRIVIGDALSLRIEARNLIYHDTFVADGLIGSDIQNHIMLNIGIGFFVPPTSRAVRLRSPRDGRSRR